MTRAPTPAELDALAAWWLSKRHIGRAAFLLGKKRQTIANQLQALRRLEGATDTVELALNHMDEIQARTPAILGRAA